MSTRTPAGDAFPSARARCGAARSHALVALLAGVTLGSAGCVVTRPDATSTPPVQLMSAGELNLPDDCMATAGTVYRTLFEVQPDGRVTAPRSEPGETNGCVQQALREWVATFSYAPLDAPTPVAFDWMAVTASRR